MFKRILVPLDGSARADQALPVAARIARASGSSIHLLQVLNLTAAYGGGLASVSFVTDQSIDLEMSQSTDYLHTVAASSVLTGIPTTIEVSVGHPAQCILETADTQESDLIVMSSHGRTGFTNWALGSVAHTLAHESTTPLLVLRENSPVSLRSRTESARSLCALVPLDGSDCAEAALIPAARLVAALSAPTHGALHLAQVVPFILEKEEGGFVNEADNGALDHARIYLAQVTERLQTTMKDLNLSVTSSVEFEKDVSRALLHTAEHRGKGKEVNDPGACDLIAISTHGRGGLERWVMGSVTDRLLTNTSLPMLIVRPQKMNKGEK